MKVTALETCPVSAGWKNWLLLKVHANARIHGTGEGALNGVIRTTEVAVREHFTWHPTLNLAHRHHSLPDAPGLAIDVKMDAAPARGIPVSNIPHCCIDEVADHTLAFVPGLTRQVVTPTGDVRTAKWGLAVPVTDL